jgi:hypothetical protein
VIVTRSADLADSGWWQTTAVLAQPHAAPSASSDRPTGFSLAA